jgi:hypothetical protein
MNRAVRARVFMISTRRMRALRTPPRALRHYRASPPLLRPPLRLQHHQPRRIRLAPLLPLRRLQRLKSRLRLRPPSENCPRQLRCSLPCPRRTLMRASNRLLPHQQPLRMKGLMRLEPSTILVRFEFARHESDSKAPTFTHVILRFPIFALCICCHPISGTAVRAERD